MPLPAPDPAVAGGVGGAARRLRRARHRAGIPERARARARPGAQGRAARRRRRDALRPVPRRARCTGRPAVVEESGLCVDGWIPVDPLTLETSFPDVYAVGDVTSVGTPKAGVFAEGQAAVVADAIIARHRGGDADRDVRRPRHLLPRVRRRPGRPGSTSRSSAAQRRSATLDGPSAELAADKSEFGSSRIRRWFGREWSTT